MRLRALSLLSLALLSATLLRAQPAELATLTGTVVDAEAGTPLEGVHVFIAVSMNGTTTDADGRFRLERVPLGAHRLYASMLGYDPEARDVLLRQGGEHAFDFRLVPATYELDEVTVVGKEDRRWQQRLEKFVRLFLGETPNAARTRIVNPEVLDFSDAAGRFTARAAAPLVIENDALGYRITYFLKDFVATPQRVKWDGEPLFEEMVPESPARQAQWTARRDSAFYGSWRHFILAVLADRVEEQGFKLYHRPAEGPRMIGGLGAGPRPGRGRFPLRAQEIYSGGEVPTEKVLDFHGFVEFVYTGETEDPSFLRLHDRPGRPKYQTSMLLLEEGPTVVDYKGDTQDPYGVTFFGYLAFERVADQLPKEFRPR